MATSQLSKKDTAAWMAKHGASARFDYIARCGGYTVQATLYRATPQSIWLDHFKTESAAKQAIRMLQPKTVSAPVATSGNLFDESDDPRDASR